jgi:twinkle protein
LQAGLTAEVLTACVRAAEVITPERLKSIFDFEQGIWEKFHPSGAEQLGYTLPWGNSNKKSLPFRFRLGEVTVWTGHNGHGKSQVLNHCIVALAWQGLRSLICSFEMAAPETYRRLIRMVRAEAKPADCARADFAARCLKPLADKVWVYDHVGMAELDEVLDVARYARRRYNVRMVVIDSLMCLKVTSDEDKYTEQKNFMNRLTQFAAENRMHIVLVAHSKKMDVKGNKEHAIPRKYDIAGSADISNLAWNVCVIWRNKKKEERLREMWDECAIRAGKPSDAMTAADFDKYYTQEDKDEVEELVQEKDAFFLVDKQRGGEGDEPVRNLWFDRSTLQYLEKPRHQGGAAVSYWQRPVRVLGDEPDQETTEAMSTAEEAI